MNSETTWTYDFCINHGVSWFFNIEKNAMIFKKGEKEYVVYRDQLFDISYTKLIKKDLETYFS